ncbi:MAG: hypothetical protein IPG60_07555 [Bacteroidetes bacterium]|nr:hypothetical protein [Bacteroidota bacterium]
MKIYYLFFIIILYSRCSTQKVLPFDCNDIVSCSGTVYYNFIEEGFTTYNFIIENKEDVQRLCKMMQQSNQTSQLSKPKKNATIIILITFEDGKCKEIRFVNLTNGVCQFTIMDACKGNKWVQGDFSNNKIDDFFIEYFKKDSIDIGILNVKYR